MIAALTQRLPHMCCPLSIQAHSSVQKAANIAGLGVNMRLIPARGRGGEASDNAYALDPADLAAAMKEDVAAGLTPMFVTASVGSTNSCAIDPVLAIGKICRRWRCGPGGVGPFLLLASDVGPKIWWSVVCQRLLVNGGSISQTLLENTRSTLRTHVLTTRTGSMSCRILRPPASWGKRAQTASSAERRRQRRA